MSLSLSLSLSHKQGIQGCSAGWSTMYPQGEEFHQKHIAEYVYRNIAALAGMPPSLYNRAARFFFYVTPSWIFNWSMR